ncbi:MAG: flagellar hook-basal body protein [Lachnospiraceae bacterium]
MRVTNASTTRNFTSSINDVHYKLNKSMNKVSTGKAYESAAENPLAYYEGKKIDNQYQDVISKLGLITDVKSRLYEQELGARDIQKTLSDAKVKVEYILSGTNNSNPTTVGTIRDDLMQKQQAMVNELNSKYQNFYIYGGNDLSSTPFSLSEDGMTLTFKHVFPGDKTATEITMELKEDPNNPGSYSYDISDPDKLLQAMREQGRVDIGYGDISNKDTLLDTYTGGLNLITGLNSDSLKAMNDQDALKAIQERLDNSPIGLLGKSIATLNKQIDGLNNGTADTDKFTEDMGKILDQMTLTEHNISTVYSDLGNKYALLETTEENLTNMKISLTEQYKDKLGADPYEAIMEMFSYQYSYSAAQQVATRLFQSSLFDFMR